MKQVISSKSGRPLLGRRTSTRLGAAIAATVLMLSSSIAAAAGFSEQYEARVGDLNGDGLTDIYVARVGGITIVPLDDLIIPVPTGGTVSSFVLQNNGQRGFDLIRTLTSQQRDRVRSFQKADVDVRARDADADGILDLQIDGVARVVSSAFDQIIYAPSQGNVPRALTAINEKFDKYHSDLLEWIIDPTYFTRNTFFRVINVEPATRTWFGSVGNGGNSPLISIVAAQCRAAFPNNDCGVSSAPPQQCIRRVDLLDQNGQFVGSTTRDVCPDDAHIYVYTRGTVTLQPDLSATDADARETAEILEDFNIECLALDPAKDRALGDILRRVYGENLKRPLSDRFANSIDHPAYPGDQVFDRDDKTFHHYDVTTRVCNVGDNGCNLSTIENEVLRKFTYPSRQLRPRLTAVDNIEQLIAFVTAPFLTSFPSTYIREAGPIKQTRLLQGGFSQGAIRNQTLQSHLVFPGFISRKLFQDSKGIKVFTHGVGVNRHVPFTNTCLDRDKAGWVQIIIAAGNDKFGASAFKQLDREMVKFYGQVFIGMAIPPPFAATFVEPQASKAAPQ